MPEVKKQKIERVINVMRALSKYMNTLFEGKIEDDKRVASATHIKGDATEDLADGVYLSTAAALAARPAAATPEAGQGTGPASPGPAESLGLTPGTAAELSPTAPGPGKTAPG